tara:strand:- start:353 stop:529 length:177 start_codon:yes stop_codon:yes gene_type:complete
MLAVVAVVINLVLHRLVVWVEVEQEEQMLLVLLELLILAVVAVVQAELTMVVLADQAL